MTKITSIRDLWNPSLSVLVVAAFAIALAGCPEKGAGERAGENLDEAMEDVQDSAEDVGDEVGDAMEDAGDEVEDALD